MSIPLERLDALWNATDAWLDLSPPEKRRRLVAQWEASQGGLAPGSSADAVPPPPIPVAGSSRGGRGRPTVSSIVIAHGRSGMTEPEIRAELQTKGYSQPRIAQLMRTMRETLRPDSGESAHEVEMNDKQDLERDLPELPPGHEDVGGLVFVTAEEAEERLAARMGAGEERDPETMEDCAVILGHTMETGPCLGMPTFGVQDGFRHSALIHCTRQCVGRQAWIGS